MNDLNGCSSIWFDSLPGQATLMHVECALKVAVGRIWTLLIISKNYKEDTGALQDQYSSTLRFIQNHSYNTIYTHMHTA